MIEILLILVMPLILALSPALITKNKWLGSMSAAGYAVAALACVKLIQTLLVTGRPMHFLNLVYLDALSLLFMLTILVVTFAAALYSIGFMEKEISSQKVTEKKARVYYVLFNCFVFFMLVATSVNNLGLMWVAIEMTTLVSTFLVGFYNKKESVEAAWKYLIICSVGIILALLGTILFSYAMFFSQGSKSLNWTELVYVASALDPRIVKIAFVFVLIGFGTKAGLAPMHTWLPDAHSQAVSPISALLSGVLLKTALYAIIRYSVVLNRCVGPEFSQNLLLFFGGFSLLVAAGFILVQKDIKRLLAYSSIEHIGIITIGLGLGGPLGIFGALFHVLNHAVTKSLMFFGAGNIVKKYRSHNLHEIRGVLRALPFTGAVVLLGVFALAGLPPFSIFFSEMMIIFAAFQAGSYFVGALMLALIAVIFGALIYQLSTILFGKKLEDMDSESEPLSGKLAFGFLLIFICGLGLFLPGMLVQLIQMAAKVVRGV